MKYGTMKTLGALTIGAALLLSTGCMKHTYTVGTGGSGEAKYSAWHSHWLFSIIGDTEVKVKDICPDGNATVHEEQSFVNGLIASFTGVIWSPTTVTVTCGGGGAAKAKEAKVTLSPEQMRAIARDPQTTAWMQSVAPEQAAKLDLAIRSYDRSSL